MIKIIIAEPSKLGGKQDQPSDTRRTSESGRRATLIDAGKFVPPQAAAARPPLIEKAAGKQLSRQEALDKMLFDLIESCDDVKAFKDALKVGANLRAVDSEGQTCLIRAAIFGREKITEFILSEVMNLPKALAAKYVSATDKYKTNALMRAAFKGNVVIGEMLLKTGFIDKNAQDMNGWTAMFWAGAFKQVAFFRMLLEYGADMEIPANDGDTVIERVGKEGIKAFLA